MEMSISINQYVAEIVPFDFHIVNWILNYWIWKQGKEVP